MKKPKDHHKPISPEKGKLLLDLARATIAEHLGVRHEAKGISGASDTKVNPEFTRKAGTFVTLHKHGELRGCIGHIEPDETIFQGIRSNAVNAAFSDPRFHALSSDEFEEIEIEISLLTPPEKIEYTDSDDLVAKLRPGIDGVIIKHGPRKATFLPQVWEQLPEPERFLSHLCTKAGLDRYTWKKGTLTVLTYQVTCFEE